jgi:hypothetical protein
MQRSWYPDPIYDPATSNITCSWNGSAGPDAFHAPIAAGDNITAHWDNEYDWYNPNLPFPYACNATSITNKYDCAGNHWFHGIGPILAYMADCGDDCSVVDPSTLNWFKIAEAVNKPGGLIRDASSWYQSRLVAHSNVAPGWTVTIPQELKPGNYLIRHEMMYLFGSPTQIYVNCAQLAVTSQGNRIPSSEYLVKFPGAYRMDGAYYSWPRCLTMTAYLVIYEQSRAFSHFQIPNKPTLRTKL